MDEGLRERLLDEKEQGTADSRAGAEDGLNPETSVDDWDEAEDGRPKRSSLDGDQVELDTLGDTPMDGSSGVPWNLIFAMVLVAIAVTTWVAEIEVTKNALGNTPDKYDNYYAVIWAAHMFSGLVGFAVVAILGCFLPHEEGKPSAYSMVFRPAFSMLWQTLILAIMVNASGWLWFISIIMTDDVVNTVIFQSCCVWCFVISVIVLNEKVTVIKALSTLATFAGVAIISYWPCKAKDPAGEAPDPKDALLGDTLCLCAAILYALYEVLYKLFAEDEGAAPSHEEGATPPAPTSNLRGACMSATFVTYIGLWNALVLWIPIAVGHYAGWVPFTLPPDPVFGTVLLDCALEGAYLAWIILAIAMSSPLFVTIGTVLAIPASAFMDYILHGITCPTLSFAGTGLVVTGFIGINVAILVQGRKGWPSWL
mmetsp:Transcript_54390/g.127154  ORF Transcript_54390/g.127154 Transcript_54390/m.127154 type:complete len:425 (-) Transcript_54390:160-1434(-)